MIEVLASRARATRSARGSDDKNPSIARCCLYYSACSTSTFHSLCYRLSRLLFVINETQLPLRTESGDPVKPVARNAQP
jgi:hypothetical protein